MSGARTSLKHHIATRIRQSGPISVAEYMGDCLLHPTLGYYTTSDPLGASGDFTTAPEISQMFGELLGLSLAQAWVDQGCPAPFTLAELGPGRGTLMKDALRAARMVPGFVQGAQITLIEASPVLRAAQGKALEQYAPRWITDAAGLPDQPLFVLANEFFDALPVRQFIRDAAGWSERRIGLQGDDLAFGLTAPGEQAALAHRLEDTSPGDLVEICPAAGAIISEIATRIATRGGAALIVDYGDWRSLGDTLQALQDHRPVGVLDDPGAADLTAHVDFETLALVARDAGAAVSRLTPQGVFLERLGITDRARTLAAGLDGAALENLISAHRRLTHPDEMGNLFKTLGLYPARGSPPPSPPPGLNP